MTTPEPDKHGLIATGSSGMIRRMDQRLDLVSRLIQEFQDKDSSRKNTSFRERLVAGKISLHFMVKVKGGQLPALSELGPLRVDTFHIGRTTVTWAEWQIVRDWAAENGYDLAGVGEGKGPNYPVTAVSWYATVKWCNARSEMEGSTPVYRVGGEVYRTGRLTPIVEELADGYRLPSEKEWEFAARGGVDSKGFEFSGSNDIDAVAWYSNNSTGIIHEVATKQLNELGIYDMTGNVIEWCYDARDETGSGRVFRGGSWVSVANDCCVAIRYYGGQGLTGSVIGFRLARSSVP